MIVYDRRKNQISDGDADHDLYLLFSKSRYLTFRARERELQRYQLTPEQAQVLLAVQAMEGKATPPRIARALVRQLHTISALVDRMEQKGLVRKVKDLERKNLVRVELTEKGKRAYEVTTKRGPIHRIMGALSENERDSFQQCLEKIMEKAGAELGLGRDTLPPSEVY